MSDLQTRVICLLCGSGISYQEDDQALQWCRRHLGEAHALPEQVFPPGQPYALVPTRGADRHEFTLPDGHPWLCVESLPSKVISARAGEIDTPLFVRLIDLTTTRVFTEAHLAPETAMWYRAVLERLQDAYLRLTPDPNKLLPLLGLLRRAISQVKLGTSVNLAESRLRQGGQVAVLTADRTSANAIAARLNYPVFGYTSAKQMQQMQADFAEGRQRVFIAPLRVGTEGVDLTAARDLILVDRPWSQAAVAQAESRVRRISQKAREVTIHWIQHQLLDQVLDVWVQHPGAPVTFLRPEGTRVALSGASAEDIALQVLPLLFSRMQSVPTELVSEGR